jgi:hypothetical protein
MIPLTSVLHAEARDLEGEARRIAVRAAQETQVGTAADGMALPFRVPRENDPKIWSVGVKVRDSASMLRRVLTRTAWARDRCHLPDFPPVPWLQRNWFPRYYVGFCPVVHTRLRVH